jgi:hypothetical protein
VKYVVTNFGSGNQEKTEMVYWHTHQSAVTSITDEINILIDEVKRDIDENR